MLQINERTRQKIRRRTSCGRSGVATSHPCESPVGRTGFWQFSAAALSYCFALTSGTENTIAKCSKKHLLEIGVLFHLRVDAYNNDANSCYLLLIITS